MAAGCELQAPLILTDQDVMLELMKHNIQLNQLDGKATASILDWYVVTFAHVIPTGVFWRTHQAPLPARGFVLGGATLPANTSEWRVLDLVSQV